MAQFASDAFAGTEGQELSAYNAAWTKAPTTTGNIEIVGGRVRPSSTTSPSYYHSGTPASAHYTVSADLYKTSATTANLIAVTGRQSTSANTLYRASGYRSNSAQVALQLYKFVAGTATQIGSTVSVSQADGSTHNVLRMVDQDGNGYMVSFFAPVEFDVNARVTGLLAQQDAQLAEAEFEQIVGAE